MTGHCARCGTGADPKPEYMPTADEVVRFIRSNPIYSASVLTETFRISTEADRCSNGKLREVWKQAGGVVKDKRAWIEVDLLPGLLRLLGEIPVPSPVNEFQLGKDIGRHEALSDSCSNRNDTLEEAALLMDKFKENCGYEHVPGSISPERRPAYQHAAEAIRALKR